MTHTQDANFPRTTLPEAARKEVTGLLQGALADLIDLALIGKQAHWAVVGPTFQSLHEKLDALVDEYRMASDELAERALMLGMVPDGRAATVASESQVDPFPEGTQAGTEVIRMMADRLADSIKRMRASQTRCGDLDSVTEDLFIGIIGKLEMQLWMLQAQEK